MPLFILTFGMLVGFGYSIASLNINEIKKHWNERRCDIPVLFSSWLYKPDYYDGDSSQFAADNFTFCMGNMITASLSLFMNPVIGMFKQTLISTSVVSDVSNALKSTATKGLTEFLGIFNPFFKRFDATFTAVKNAIVRLNFAMSRTSATILAVVYAFIASIKTLENTIGFVIRVVIIILIILVAIFILLFFVLFPFTPLILSTITVITATVFAGAVGGMASTFCVPEGTLVLTAQGPRPVEHLHTGDTLDHGQHIEGILVANGEQTPFVTIHDIPVGAGHIVYDSSSKQWCLAKDHSSAIESSKRFTRVYCLNTSDRTWKVVSGNQELLLRDWEELPDSPLSDSAWSYFTSIKLNSDIPISHNRPLFGPNTPIQTQRGLIPISQVRIGDYIQDGNTYTEVLATIIDTSDQVPEKGPNSAVLFQADSYWLRCSLSYSNTTQGYNLITTSGTFSSSGILYRDFTEVGLEELDTSSSWILDTVNKS